MLPEIQNRRSIRRYKPTPIPRALIEEILQSGCLAPSSKNRQPWHFIVVTDSAKESLLKAMNQGLARERTRPLLPESREHLGGAEHTLGIMAQAPVIIMMVNELGLDIHRQLTPEEHIYELCNAQSIGAAMENMCLTAAEHGLGSLWICDTYFAQDELNAWLNTKGELIAALALGFPDEAPAKRPRKPLSAAVEWRQ